MSEIIYRRATSHDIDFVASAIVAAEQSGTERTLYERVFDLGRDELAAMLKSVLAEEIPGSELCCESFVLAVDDGVPVACAAAWIEAEGGQSSAVVRSMLLSFALGDARWRGAERRLRLLGAIDVGREKGALQIESVYVGAGHRGRGLACGVLTELVSRYRITHPGAAKAQILSALGNARVEGPFARAGFTVTRRTRSDDPELVSLFPGGGRILWERPL